MCKIFKILILTLGLSLNCKADTLENLDGWYWADSDPIDYWKDMKRPVYYEGYDELLLTHLNEDTIYFCLHIDSTHITACVVNGIGRLQNGGFEYQPKDPTDKCRLKLSLTDGKIAVTNVKDCDNYCGQENTMEGHVFEISKKQKLKREIQSNLSLKICPSDRKSLDILSSFSKSGLLSVDKLR